MKIAYVIGRFQPFHKGHEAIVRKALDIADKVVVVIGDTGCRLDFKNPWTVHERVNMIHRAFPGESHRLNCVSVEDVPYDNAEWKLKVKEAVAPHTFTSELSELPVRILVGFKKDESSFYLAMFPEWQFVETEPYLDAIGRRVDATQIRFDLFIRGVHPEECSALPKNVAGQIALTMDRARFNDLAVEGWAVLNHKNDWDCAATRRYGGPVLTAVDALIHTDDEVLLIRRKGAVGAGALALPGGFVDPNERLVDAALRELKEETGVVIDRRDLPACDIGMTVAFDSPSRSMRGRIITNVLQVKVPKSAVKNITAGDDAIDAFMMLKSELAMHKREFFSDHYHIIKYFI